MKYKYGTEGTGQMLDDHCCTCADSSPRYSEHVGIWHSQLKHKSDKERQEEWWGEIRQSSLSLARYDLISSLHISLFIPPLQPTLNPWINPLPSLKLLTIESPPPPRGLRSTEQNTFRTGTSVAMKASERQNEPVEKRKATQRKSTEQLSANQFNSWALIHRSCVKWLPHTRVPPPRKFDRCKVIFKLNLVTSDKLQNEPRLAWLINMQMLCCLSSANQESESIRCASQSLIVDLVDTLVFMTIMTVIWGCWH